MIRPFTLIAMMLAALSGAYLFGVKHRAQMLDDQLALIAQNARNDQKDIRVLQAQWAAETDPNRLKALAGAYLTLQAMKPAQLVTLNELRDALPPPDSAAPAVNPAAPGAALVAAAAPANPALPATASPAPAMAGAMLADASFVTSPPAPAALPLPPPRAPNAPSWLAAVRPAAAARPPHLAARGEKSSPSHLAGAQWARNLPPPRPLYSPAREPGAPMGAQIVSVSASPLPAGPPAASAAGPDNGGSLLGMATDLAPPPDGSGN